MGLGSYYKPYPSFCFSTEDYSKWMNKQYQNTDDDDDDDDEKLIPKRFYLPYCDECEKYREFVNNLCSHHRSHRFISTCNFLQNDFKTFSNREVRCSSCFWLFECQLKIYTFEKFKKLANVNNIKGRKQCYIIEELVQKVETYIL